MSYEVHCIFCRRTHRSEFFDEIEDGILACRETAPEWKRGDMATEEPTMTVEHEVARQEARTIAASLLLAGDGP